MKVSNAWCQFFAKERFHSSAFTTQKSFHPNSMDNFWKKKSSIFLTRQKKHWEKSIFFPWKRKIICDQLWSKARIWSNLIKSFLGGGEKKQKDVVLQKNRNGWQKNTTTKQKPKKDMNCCTAAVYPSSNHGSKSHWDFKIPYLQKVCPPQKSWQQLLTKSLWPQVSSKIFQNKGEVWRETKNLILEHSIR